MKPNFLTVDPEENPGILKGLASPVRISILKALHAGGELNVNEISAALDLPQSTVATNVQMLEEAGLVKSRTVKARKGHQKICAAVYDEIVVRFDTPKPQEDSRVVEVAMPIGLFTSVEVSAPCGLCSTDGVIGLLDVPDSFLDPDRVKASLIWFGRGYVEYKFPNNARLLNTPVEEIEFSLELSSEVPGTNVNWPSDITLWVNQVAAGTWTSPGDYGDKRGVFTPNWWKLEGSQYGKLKTWRVNRNGTWVDGVRISRVTVADLELPAHHAIRVRIGIDEHASHPGGVNIFGKGFGNYDQDIVMRLRLADADAAAAEPSRASGRRRNVRSGSRETARPRR